MSEPQVIFFAGADGTIWLGYGDAEEIRATIEFWRREWGFEGSAEPPSWQEMLAAFFADSLSTSD